MLDLHLIECRFEEAETHVYQYGQNLLSVTNWWAAVKCTLKLAVYFSGDQHFIEIVFFEYCIIFHNHFLSVISNKSISIYEQFGESELTYEGKKA